MPSTAPIPVDVTGVEPFASFAAKVADASVSEQQDREAGDGERDEVASVAGPGEWECHNCRRGQCAQCKDRDCSCCRGNED